jgi:hypothetical protein
VAPWIDFAGTLSPSPGTTIQQALINIPKTFVEYSKGQQQATKLQTLTQWVQKINTDSGDTDECEVQGI